MELRTIRTLFTLVGLVASVALFPQAPKTLLGLEYRGTTKSDPMEGCEGCGNAGFIHFQQGNRVEYLLPGSDIIELALYTRKRDSIALERGGGDMELKGDSLFFTIYGYRHVYLRVRDRR